MNYNWAIFLLLFGCACSEVTTQKDRHIYSLCDGLVNGEVKPSPLDCSSYIECTLDGALIRYCDDGLEYDAKLRICNWPQYANCNIDKTHQVAEEQLPIRGNIVDTVASTSNSASSLPGFETSTDQSFEKNPWSQSPVRPVFIAIDVSNGLITDPMAKYNPHHIECRHFGAYFLPHPRSCRQYFVCAYGHLHQHHCGRGTLWNYLTEECELSDMAICYSMAVGEETDDLPENENYENGAGTTSSDRPHTVTQVSDSTSYLPHTSPVYPPTVCYTIATAGTTLSSDPTTQSTWTGYSPTSTMTSEYTTPLATDTTTAPITTTSNSDATTTTTTKATTDKIASSTPRADTTIIPTCPSNSQVYLPHKKDCSKYYICIMGMPVLTSCPQGLRWDQNAEFCDSAKNVECKLTINLLNN